ncbi:MAG: hypothetical protein M3P70_02715, partial [Actinomycetota bacterium]|nr:hypothetical protein [Actinomycetota bacterium]
ARLIAGLRSRALFSRPVGALRPYVFVAALGGLPRVRGGPVSRLLRRPLAGVRPVGALRLDLFYAAFGWFLGVLLLFAHRVLLLAWIVPHFIPS